MDTESIEQPGLPLLEEIKKCGGDAGSIGTIKALPHQETPQEAKLRETVAEHYAMWTEMVERWSEEDRERAAQAVEANKKAQENDAIFKSFDAEQERRNKIVAEHRRIARQLWNELDPDERRKVFGTIEPVVNWSELGDKGIVVLEFGIPYDERMSGILGLLRLIAESKKVELRYSFAQTAEEKKKKAAMAAKRGWEKRWAKGEPRPEIRKVWRREREKERAALRKIARAERREQYITEADVYAGIVEERLALNRVVLSVNTIRQLAKLSGAAVKVYLALCIMRPEEQSIANITEKTKMARGTVISALRELEEQGILFPRALGKGKCRWYRL